uniref:Peptidase S1 domain-containing protein n=1 Tax=Tetranychus urticae TaxID=32264 RepID=T1L2X7_TETUR
MDSYLITAILCLLTIVNYVGVNGRLISKSSQESNFQQELGPRIIGGKFAEPGEFPYYVQVITQLGDFFPTCGGTLIKDSIVITAAHCVWDNGQPAKMVMVQSKSKRGLFLSRKPFEWQVNNGTKLIVHENYTVNDEGIPINDIALIKLDLTQSPLSSSSSAKNGIANLASKHYPIGTSVVLAGYGLTESGRSPKFLKKKDSVLINNDAHLNGILFTQRTDEDLVYIGDSGGPVIVQGKTPSQDELVGIISFGDEYLEGDREGSTDVYFYRDWIQSKVASLI